MLIRAEAEEDFDIIYDLIKTAFKTAEVADGDEQDFAVKLREGEGYIPSLALVAEDDDHRIIGHLMLTRVYLRQEENAPAEILLLAPLSVADGARNCGVGTALVREALDRAEKFGFGAVILVGNPVYYSRFGFKASIEFGISNANGIPDKYVQVIELYDGALSEIKGTIEF